MNFVIKDYIKKNHLLSLGIQDSDGVYMVSCFYAFDEKNLALIFKSDETTKHVNLMLKKPYVGVSIATHTQVLKQIKGVQIKAKVLEASLQQEKIYNQCYPFAKLIKGKIFSLEILWIKYTDNQLVLKKKIEWTRDILRVDE